MQRLTCALWVLGGIVALGCNPPNQGCPGSLTDGGSPDFLCTGVSPVTLTTLQADVLTPTCAKSTCHIPQMQGGLSHDYSNLTASAEIVGMPSTYGGTLKVVAPGDLLDSTMWLKVLGGSPKYSGPAPDCKLVGAAMPFDGTVLDAGQIAQIKGWICGGAH